MQVAQVLQLVVEHCPELRKADKTVAVPDRSGYPYCTLLQLSTACRKALQETVGHMELATSPDRPDYLSRLASFAAWLPKHGGLVSSITVEKGEHNEQQAAAGQLIASALQLSAVVAAGDPATVQAAAVLADYDSPKPLGLQLRRFSTNCLHSPAVLHALAACSSVTMLELSGMTPASADNSALHAALARLSSLQELLWEVEAEDHVLQASFAAAVQHLQWLQALYLSDQLPIKLLSKLPSSLEILELQLSHDEASAVAVELSHLTCLKHLLLNAEAPISAASKLPASLTTLFAAGPIEAVTGLHRLCGLSLKKPAESAALLQTLPSLPELRDMGICLGSCPEAALHDVMAAIGAATRLTRLALAKPWHVGDPSMQGDVMDLGAVQLHEHLLKLASLQSIYLCQLAIQPQDALHFTALTSLTTLVFDVCPTVGDFAVAAIAGRLTGLRTLELRGCHLSSPLLWPALAGLTGLKSLAVFEGMPRLGRQATQLLSSLTQLSSLTFDAASVRLSAAGAAAFKAALPQLKEYELI